MVCWVWKTPDVQEQPGCWLKRGETRGYFWKPEPGRHVGVGSVGHSGKKPELRLESSSGETALELGGAREGPGSWEGAGRGDQNVPPPSHLSSDSSDLWPHPISSFGEAMVSSAYPDSIPAFPVGDSSQTTQSLLNLTSSIFYVSGLFELDVAVSAFLQIRSLGSERPSVPPK